MNSFIRATARGLRSGAAVYGPRPADVWSAPGRRLLCAAAGDVQKDLGEKVKKDKVVVFIKGTTAQPMCGFSNAVVQILRMHGVDDYAAYNVLDDQELREGEVERSSHGGGKLLPVTLTGDSVTGAGDRLCLQSWTSVRVNVSSCQPCCPAPTLQWVQV